MDAVDRTKVLAAAEEITKTCQSYWDRGKSVPHDIYEAGMAALQKVDKAWTDGAVRPFVDGGGGAGWVSSGSSPGETFTKSAALREYAGAGYPRGPSGKALVGSFHTKAVPTIGSGVVAPARDAEVVRTTGQDRLTVRDVLTTAPTTSNSIEYVRITSAQPEIAAPVAESGEKPASTLALDTASAPVRTLAVHMPVTEQQLQDVPALQQTINDELTFDVRRLEEYQLIWGDGLGQNLLGIMETPDVDEFTRDLPGTETLLDQVRGAISDIQMDGLEPNALLVHPIDYETLLLTKGSDLHYLSQAFPGQLGQSSIWGLRVIVTKAVEAYRSADTTDQRVMIVGDFRRGATLWDRQQATVEVGFINDQFILNQRTIRAEERVAFAVRRPYAFKFIETVAAVA